jgi:hypothetical protein
MSVLVVLLTRVSADHICKTLLSRTTKTNRDPLNETGLKVVRVLSTYF